MIEALYQAAVALGSLVLIGALVACLCMFLALLVEAVAELRKRFR